MSIHSTEDADNALVMGVPRDVGCFYCYGAFLSGHAVMWMGNSVSVWLHPQCVVELTIRLLRDVHEIECRSSTYITGAR